MTGSPRRKSLEIRACRGRSGFTLTELLVVVALIVLLAVLLIPSATRMLRRSSDIVCQNNLHAIGVSGSLQGRDSLGDSVAFSAPEEWYQAILRDTQGDGRILRCPLSTTDVTTGTTPPDEGDGSNLAEEAARAFEAYKYRVRLGEWDGYPWMPPQNPGDVVPVWNTSFRYLYFPLDGQSYFNRKIAHSDYLIMRNNDYRHPQPAMDYDGNQVYWRDVPVTILHDVPGLGAWGPEYCYQFNYSPGDDQYSYWLYAESGIIPPDADPAVVGSTMAGGWHAVNERDGTGWWYGGRAGYRYFWESPCQNVAYWVQHKDDGTTLIKVRKFDSMAYGHPALVKKAATPETDEVLIDQYFGSEKWAAADFEEYLPVTIGTPGEVPPPPGGDTVTITISYGINPGVVDPAGLGPEKVLAMDYEHLVVSPDDEEWAQSLPTFARHDGQANVLFRGGSVKAVKPAEIDPSVPSKLGAFWKP